ncbi:MAG: hypothetical protein M9915_11885 [Rhizobacter sp.]|nr:hypothetical protein [Rhizobacter sp.]
MPFQKPSMRPCLSLWPARAISTCFSKLATRRRSMPKTWKKAFQKLCASARSEVSADQSLLNAMARDLISFQLSGIGRSRGSAVCVRRLPRDGSCGRILLGAF